MAVKPASAAALAGLWRLVGDGVIDKGDSVVLVLTGHGLKDPDAMASASTMRLKALGVEDAVKKDTSAGQGLGVMPISPS
ncbi:MAG: hypothetical protein ABWW69_00435 [Pyrodictiaceae archaeon]